MVAARLFLCSILFARVVADPHCNKHSYSAIAGHESSSTDKKADDCGARVYFTYYYVVELLQSAVPLSAINNNNLGLWDRFIGTYGAAQPRVHGGVSRNYIATMLSGKFTAAIVMSEDYRRFVSGALPDCRMCNLDPKSSIAHLGLSSSLHSSTACESCAGWLRSKAKAVVNATCPMPSRARNNAMGPARTGCLPLVPKALTANSGTVDDIPVEYKNWTCMPDPCANANPAQAQKWADILKTPYAISTGTNKTGDGCTHRTSAHNILLDVKICQNTSNYKMATSSSVAFVADDGCFGEFIDNEEAAHYTVMWEGLPFEAIYPTINGTDNMHGMAKTVYASEIEFVPCPTAAGAFERKAFGFVFALLGALLIMSENA